MRTDKNKERAHYLDIMLMAKVLTRDQLKEWAEELERQVKLARQAAEVFGKRAGVITISQLPDFAKELEASLARIREISARHLEFDLMPDKSY